MKKLKKTFIFCLVIFFIILSTISFAFYLYVGQPRSEVINALGKPSRVEISVDPINGKIERCQWGSDRVGGSLIIWFKNGKVLSFQTKGNVGGK